MKLDPDRLVLECQDAMAETEPRAAVRDVLERSIRHPTALDTVLPAKHQQMTLLHVSDNLTIFQAVNAPGFYFKPHDHGCWSAVAFCAGRSRDTFYRRTPGGLAAAGGRDYDDGDVALMGAKTIHATENPLRCHNAAILVFAGNPFAAAWSMWNPGVPDHASDNDGPRVSPDSARRLDGSDCWSPLSR